MGDVTKFNEWKKEHPRAVERVEKIRKNAAAKETGVIKEFNTLLQTEADAVAQKILRFKTTKDIDARTVERYETQYASYTTTELAHKLAGSGEEGWAINPIHFRVIAETYRDKIRHEREEEKRTQTGQ